MKRTLPLRFLFVAIIAAFVVYTGVWVYLDRDVIPASEIRVYATDKDKKLLLHLQGNEARKAARHFVFENGAWCDRSLTMNIAEQVQAEFWNGHEKLQVVSFNLNDGETELLSDGCNKYLTKESRLYWKQLVKVGRSSPRK